MLFLSFYASSKHGQRKMHSQSLIPHCSGSLVAAPEDDTCDQNGRPSTPPHLTPSTPPSPQQVQTLTQSLVLRLWHLLSRMCVLSQSVPLIDNSSFSDLFYFILFQCLSCLASAQSAHCMTCHKIQIHWHGEVHIRCSAECNGSILIHGWFYLVHNSIPSYIHQHIFSHLAGAQFADSITCLTIPNFVLV